MKSMDIFEALMTRRSIRQFTSDPVSEAAILKVLEAAMMAPSAGNAQPWHFVLVTDRGLLDKIAEIHPYAGMSRDAAAGILICGDLRCERYPGNWPADCSAATQNILLALHGLGLGGVWTGIWPGEELMQNFRELLGLPDEAMPLAFVPFGWPASVPPTPARYQPDRVHLNGW